MFAGTQQLMTIHQPGEAVLARLTGALKAAGYTVTQSFDLQSTGDMASCGCFEKVLLVYGQDGPPATLLLDSGPGKTTLSLVNNLDDDCRPDWVDRLPEIILG